MKAEEVKVIRYIAEMDGEDITPKQDGGVLKRMSPPMSSVLTHPLQLIKKEGSGTELPMTGDKVYIHYTGTLLDGTEFESSRGREMKFCFELGKGEVIKAWDLGVATMKAEEVSRFICKPEYAYGQSGSPPKVPPSATLVFEVELFKFHGEDVTEDKDGGVIRRIVTKGGGHCKPTEGTTVQGRRFSLCRGRVGFEPPCECTAQEREAPVTVEGMFGGGAFDRRELSFVIGYGESLGLPAGVETAIMSMEEGEESVFTLTPKYGFGKAGNAEFHVPPDAALQYRIKLSEFEKARESWQMNMAEKLEESSAAKEKGARFFKEGKYRLAVVQYKRILAWLAHESDRSEPHGKEVRALRLAVRLNLAVCYLKMQEPAQAAENCNTALELDDCNEKALFRRAQACFAMGEFERALNDFQRLLQLYPENRAARAQVALCQRRVKEQHEKDKRLYASLFRKCSDRDIKKEGLKDEKEEEEASRATDVENGGRDQKAA
ncbi:peptidyl-prolyl cis-trans isomerase FKBP4-like isoform X3 [Scleropages formosus]|uniref:peptidyl-prolyl cis-trans isomerase FKBP4-like isoform X3 n=1 Tax=Scleropages formosus TaxID=113540 RepID=UPI0010FA996A|nr:peptidyl-prolyl cis-trans isomerase FKBP4-like isoform X3 [Scleropages formosus]